MPKKTGYILLALLVLGGFSMIGKNALASNGVWYPSYSFVSNALKTTSSLVNAAHPLYSPSLGFGAELKSGSYNTGSDISAVFANCSANTGTGGNCQGSANTALDSTAVSDGYNLTSLSNGSYYIILRYSHETGSPDFDDYVFPFSVSGGTLIPIDENRTRFTQISVSTTTQKLNLQGYWQASSTIYVQQFTENETLPLNIYPEAFGGSGFTNSTSSGTFDLDFRIFQTGCLSETSSTTICTTDKTYTYQAILYDGQYPNQQYPLKDSTSTSLIYPYQGTSTIFANSYTEQFYSGTLGTSSLTATTSFLSFLNVPDLLRKRIPFAYIFQIADGIYEGINSSSTGEIPSGNFVWHNTQNGTTTFDFFSKNTIETYLSPSIISLWRALLLAILTIEFGYAIYRRTKAHKII